MQGGRKLPKASKFGITVRAITPDLADRLGIPSGKGVVVQDAKQGGFAEDLGLNRGDVILEVNKQPVNNEDDFRHDQSPLKSGQDVVFLVRPRGQGTRVAVPSSWEAHCRKQLFTRHLVR